MSKFGKGASFFRVCQGLQSLNPALITLHSISVTAKIFHFSFMSHIALITATQPHCCRTNLITVTCNKNVFHKQTTTTMFSRHLPELLLGLYTNNIRHQVHQVHVSLTLSVAIS